MMMTHTLKQRTNKNKKISAQTPNLEGENHPHPVRLRRIRGVSFQRLENVLQSVVRTLSYRFCLYQQSEECGSDSTSKGDKQDCGTLHSNQGRQERFPTIN